MTGRMKLACTAFLLVAGLALAGMSGVAIANHTHNAPGLTAIKRSMPNGGTDVIK
jgi:hypothetical protein